MPARRVCLTLSLLLLLAPLSQRAGARGLSQIVTTATLTPAPVSSTPTPPSPSVTPTTPPQPSPTATPRPSPPPPPSPTRTPTPVPITRVIVLLPGLCANDATIGLVCYPHPNRRIDASWRAWSTFRTLLGALGPWMVAGGVVERGYSYRIRPSLPHPDWYYAADTTQPIARSAKALDAQLRALAAAYPDATFDLVGHSLGGVVAAYWAAHVASPSLLARVHGLIALDSPLQGNWAGRIASFLLGNRFTLIERTLTGAAGRDLDPSSPVMRAVRDSATTRLRGRVHTIGNWRDIIVPAGESWLAGARDNRDIVGCDSHDTGCHGTVLRDADATALQVRWIEGTG